jgi:hypothetical protein
MQHLITLYTPELITIGLLIVSAVLAVTSGALGFSLRTRGKELDTAIERHNSLREELTDTQAKLATAEKERDTWKKTAKEVEADRDSWKQVAQAEMEKGDRLFAERATLYFRNALGRIEPITPKPIKPHTLKHGMTVKDPSPYQAKRIFAAAKRAGILSKNKSHRITGSLKNIWYYKGNTNFDGVTACGSLGDDAFTYISAREFLRRIKGEIA